MPWPQRKITVAGVDISYTTITTNVELKENAISTVTFTAADTESKSFLASLNTNSEVIVQLAKSSQPCLAPNFVTVFDGTIQELSPILSIQQGQICKAVAYDHGYPLKQMRIAEEVGTIYPVVSWAGAYAFDGTLDNWSSVNSPNGLVGSIPYIGKYSGLTEVLGVGTSPSYISCALSGNVGNSSNNVGAIGAWTFALSPDYNGGPLSLLELHIVAGLTDNLLDGNSTPCASSVTITPYWTTQTGSNPTWNQFVNGSFVVTAQVAFDSLTSTYWDCYSITSSHPLGTYIPSIEYPNPPVGADYVLVIKPSEVPYWNANFRVKLQITGYTGSLEGGVSVAYMYLKYQFNDVAGWTVHELITGEQGNFGLIPNFVNNVLDNPNIPNPNSNLASSGYPAINTNYVVMDNYNNLANLISYIKFPYEDCLSALQDIVKYGSALQFLQNGVGYHWTMNQTVNGDGSYSILMAPVTNHNVYGDIYNGTNSIYNVTQPFIPSYSYLESCITSAGAVLASVSSSGGTSGTIICYEAGYVCLALMKSSGNMTLVKKILDFYVSLQNSDGSWYDEYSPLYGSLYPPVGNDGIEGVGNEWNLKVDSDCALLCNAMATYDYLNSSTRYETPVALGMTFLRNLQYAHQVAYGDNLLANMIYEGTTDTVALVADSAECLMAMQAALTVYGSSFECSNSYSVKTMANNIFYSLVATAYSSSPVSYVTSLPVNTETLIPFTFESYISYTQALASMAVYNWSGFSANTVGSFASQAQNVLTQSESETIGQYNGQVYYPGGTVEFTAYTAEMAMAMATVNSALFATTIANSQNFLELMCLSNGALFDQIDSSGEMYVSVTSEPNQPIVSGNQYLVLNSALALLAGSYTQLSTNPYSGSYSIASKWPLKPYSTPFVVKQNMITQQFTQTPPVYNYVLVAGKYQYPANDDFFRGLNFNSWILTYGSLTAGQGGGFPSQMAINLEPTYASPLTLEPSIKFTPFNSSSGKSVFIYPLPTTIDFTKLIGKNTVPSVSFWLVTGGSTSNYNFRLYVDDGTGNPKKDSFFEIPIQPNAGTDNWGFYTFNLPNVVYMRDYGQWNITADAYVNSPTPTITLDWSDLSRVKYIAFVCNANALLGQSYFMVRGFSFDGTVIRGAYDSASIQGPITVNGITYPNGFGCRQTTIKDSFATTDSLSPSDTTSPLTLESIYDLQRYRKVRTTGEIALFLDPTWMAGQEIWIQTEYNPNYTNPSTSSHYKIDKWFRITKVTHLFDKSGAVTKLSLTDDLTSSISVDTTDVYTTLTRSLNPDFQSKTFGSIKSNADFDLGLPIIAQDYTSYTS